MTKLKWLLLFFILSCFYNSLNYNLLYASSLYKFPSNAQIIIVDALTDIPLYQQNAENIIFPASFTKLMTAEIILHALKTHQIEPYQLVPITNEIWQKGGAPSGTFTMFTKPNSKVSVKNLLFGLISDNANDAAIALSLAVAGTEENFVNLMNKRAKLIGMHNTHFANVTGLPMLESEQTTTVNDMMILLKYVLKTYPEYQKISQEPSFCWNNITQNNKNFLLRLLHPPIKTLTAVTAYSKSNGYMMLGAVENNNRKSYFAFTQASSKDERKLISTNIVNWLYNVLDYNILFKKGQFIKKIEAYAGKQPFIDAIAQNDVYGFYAKDDKKFTKITLNYKTPWIAPIYAGKILGQISTSVNNHKLACVDIIAKKTVPALSFYQKFKVSLYQLTIGWWVNSLHHSYSQL